MSDLKFYEKIRGEKVFSGLPRPKLKDAIISGLGGMLIIGFLYILHEEFQVFSSFILPFGASAVLVSAAPASPFSQPRNVILGHLVSALVGMLVFSMFPVCNWWVLLLANGFAIFFMVLLKAVHPPAGATALLPVLIGISDFTWLLEPVLAGSVIVVLVGILYNNLFKERRYPVFWL